MDFSLGPAETEWRDRVRAFMDEHVRPRVRDYDAQQREGERWKVLPVVEELKGKARSRGLWNLFMPPSHGAVPVDDSFEFEGPGLSQPAICVLRRGDGPHRLGVGGVQLLRARHRQHGGASPLRHARAEGRVAEAADGRRNPLRLPDDRARRRFIGRHQHQVQHRTARQRICDQRPQMVVERCGRSALQDRDPDGQDRSLGRDPQAAVDDPRAARHAGDDDQAPSAGVRL